MGENLDVPGREAVRTPMQWSQDKNGGFSSARPSRLARKVVEGPFGPEHVNAAQARRDDDSLLHHISRLARRYRDCPELGWGDLEILDQPHQEVLAHRMSNNGQSVILVHNLSPKSLVVPLTLEDEDQDTELVDLLQDGVCAIDPQHRTEVMMEGYGYRWLRVKRPGDPCLL